MKNKPGNLNQSEAAKYFELIITEIILQMPNFGIFKSAIVKMKQNSSVAMNTKWYSYLTIIGRGWAKYRDLFVTRQ